MKLAILAKGKSLAEYPGEGFDEVWGLNQTAQSHKLDRAFVMDDLELRQPYYDGPEFGEWLKTYPGRVITSKQYDAWPTSEEFPLIDVAKYFGLPLGIAMYSSVDYMLALAIYEGVGEVHLFGVDCTEASMQLIRLSIGVWIGAAMSRGIRVVCTEGSTFRWVTSAGVCMEQGLYGYVEKPRIEQLVEIGTAA